jgi:acetylornithine deacetylase
VLQLAGHLDTISSAHAPPTLSGDVITGRGACDMKGGLAAMAEAAQVLSECGARLGGSLLVTAHGQHEEAGPGRSLHAPLLGLLERGVMGSACIIAEGPHEHVPIAGRGLVIFKATFSRPGDPVHEILAGTDPPPNPVMACHRLVRHLEDASRGWTESHPLAGTHSFFIGATNGGDYYNRIGSRADVWGTRRYPPGVSYADVRRELEEIAGRAAAEVGCAVDLDIQKSGQPFSLQPDEPVVVALRQGHLLETGRDLPLGAMAFSAESSQFINVGGIPAVYHGTNSATAHADHESVGIGDIERCAKVILRSIVAYVGLAP